MSFHSDSSSNDQTISTTHNKRNQNNVIHDYETNQLTKHLSITQPKTKTFVNAQEHEKDNNAKESTNNSQSFSSHDNMLLENNVVNADTDFNAIKELKTKNGSIKESKNSTNIEPLHVANTKEEKKSEKSLRSSQSNSKLHSRNRYSFENELPVKDPGPYSPNLKQVPNEATKNDDTETISKNTSHSIDEQQLRSQVQKLLIRHQEDLKLVQGTNLGIALPKPLTAIMSTLNKPQD